MGEHEAVVPGPAGDRARPEQPEVENLPGPGALVRRPREQWMRQGLYVVGLLLAGGSCCTGVFCGIAFQEAADAWQSAHSYREQLEAFKALKVPNPEQATVAFAGETLNQTGWRLKWSWGMLEARRHEVRGLRLLSVALGLGLGGACLCLLAWGLRPSAG